MKNKFSEQYYNLIKEYKYVHENGISKKNFFIPNIHTFSGHSLKPWVKHIKNIVSISKSKTILDYGCGKAKYYFNELEIENKKYKNLHDYWSISEVKLFDPGVERFSDYPNKKYDGVVCTDVLEHVLMDDLDDVVRDIFSFAKKFVFFVISTELDSKFFTNGQNVHVTVKNDSWWKSFFKKIKNDYPDVYCVVITTFVGKEGNEAKRIV